MQQVLNRLLLSIALAAVLLAGAFSSAFGQSGSTAAGLTGTVADEQGGVIPGVTVKARNLENNSAREVLSGEDGSFIFPQLAPGIYEITASAEGFNTYSSRLNLVLGTTSLFKLIMQIGASAEIIEVTASDSIDEGKTESSTNMGRERIDNLPINRRNFLDFSLTSPRVTADRAPAQGVLANSGISFNGQPARFNNITIDGLENNDTGAGAVRATFSQEAVQEFQIVSDGYSAEFGRALGGIVNIVTRRGGNDYHGNLFFFNRNDTVSARDVFASFKPPYQQYQFGATVGGPIKKDKAFFFTSFERLSIKQNNIVTISDQTVAAARSQGFALSNGAAPFSVGTTTYLARADFQLTPNDSLYARYNYGGTYNGALEPFGGLIGATNGGMQLLDDNSLGISNTYINARFNLVNETRFLYGHRNQDVLPLEAGPQVRLTAPEGFVTFGRGGFLPQTRQERIYQLVDNISLTRGRNQIKFGADLVYFGAPTGKSSLPIFPGGLAGFSRIDFSELAGIPGLPSLTGLEALDPSLRSAAQIGFLQVLSGLLPAIVPNFPAGLPLERLSLPLFFTQGFGDPNLSGPATLFSVFVQNDVKLKPNLLLKAGIRYDVNRARFIPDNNGNFSPRLAVSYRPSRFQKLSLRASYGIFFGPPILGSQLAVERTSSGAFKIAVVPFPFSIIAFDQPGHRFPESDSLPKDLNFIPQLSNVFSYQPDLRASYTQQTSAGFDYSLNNNTDVSLTYDFVRGIKLFSTRNLNPVVRPIPGDVIGSLITGRVDPSRGDANEFESAFDSYYHAFTVSLNRRFANRFGILAHYTFSKAIDDFVDIRSDQAEAVDPLRPGDERGLSLQDVRSRFVASGTWDLSYTKNILLRDFQVSAILNLNSGRPYNLLAGEDLNMNGDAIAIGDRPLIGGTSVGRNTGVTPGFANLDLRFTRSINFGERFRFNGFVEIFNAFNRVNISEVDRIYPRDAQGNFNLPPKAGGRFIAPRERYRNAFAPRQFQFGFRLTF